MNNRNAIIAANIKKYLNQKNVTQKELAMAIGISPSTLSDYMNFRSNPSHGVIQKIADYFNIVKSDIDTTYKTDSKIQVVYDKLDEVRQNRVYNFAEKQLEEQNNTNNNVILFEEYTLYQTEEEEVDIYGVASAGTGVDLFDEVIEKVLCPKPVPKHDIALRVFGDSMAPLFQDEQIIFVNRTPNIRHGQIGVFIINGKAFLKKLYKDSSSVKLVSLNPEYNDIELSEYDRVDVVGTVIL